MARTQWADCPNCGDLILVVFEALADTEDEVLDPLPVDATCSTCGHEWVVEYEGWTAHEDAG